MNDDVFENPIINIRAGLRERSTHSEPVIVIAHRAQAVEVDTPMGKMTAWYGARVKVNDNNGRAYADQHNRGDRFYMTYRGEDLWSDRLTGGRPASSGFYSKSLMDQIAETEAEHQKGKLRDKARKDAAKNPFPALLVPADSNSPRGKRADLSADRYEEVHVRGVDLRSGNALIIRADGSKESVSPSRVLNDLGDSDTQDLLTLRKRVREAEAHAATFSAPEIREVLSDVAVDLTVSIDLATGERVAEHDGREYRGATEEAIVHTIMLELIPDEWKYTGTSSECATLAEDEGLRGYDHLYRSKDEWQVQRDAEQAASEARDAVKEAESEHLFDLTLFDGVTGEPAPEPPPSDVPSGVRAPEGAGDWDEA